MKGFRQRVVSAHLGLAPRVVVCRRHLCRLCPPQHQPALRCCCCCSPVTLTLSARAAISSQGLEQIVKETRLFLQCLQCFVDPRPTSPVVQPEPCHAHLVLHLGE